MEEAEVVIKQSNEFMGFSVSTGSWTCSYPISLTILLTEVIRQTVDM